MKSEKFLVPEHEQLGRIIEARDELRRIRRDMKCTCSGFVLQYERGCQCIAGKKLAVAQHELDEAIADAQIQS